MKLFRIDQPKYEKTYIVCKNINRALEISRIKKLNIDSITIIKEHLVVDEFHLLNVDQTEQSQGDSEPSEA
jgi:hypothetical protein